MVVCISPWLVSRPFVFYGRIPYHFHATRRTSISDRYYAPAMMMRSSFLVRNCSTASQNPHRLLLHDMKLEEELPGYNPILSSQAGRCIRVQISSHCEARVWSGFECMALPRLRVRNEAITTSRQPFEFKYLMRFRSGDYLTLKVCTCRKVAGVTAQSTNEAAVTRHIRASDYEHPGDRYLRLILREFTIHGPGGEHRCLLYTPQGMTFKEFRNLLPNRLLNKALLQQTYQLILIGLDLLHQLGVVHTDISPNNILLGAQSSSIFSKIEQSELEHPSARKVFRDRVIYQSQYMLITDGTPVLCDFGAAWIGEGKHRGDVMPDFYRAPEVILGMEWDCKIDIWSIGVMNMLEIFAYQSARSAYLLTIWQIWDLFEGGRLFYALRNRILDDEQHLAEMVALMGPPPQSFLQRSEKCRNYWDVEGEYLAISPAHPPEEIIKLKLF
ncbi:serine/threonine protein kinase [Blastomyces dermatitidis ER-3]|uniref:EKC/KEOPS complex subunit BUD32 n=1 Tax=Ajellomyces dermatitidis (strain ER-3 / ATCC MYA-2586) TaxID=559297 RepID=A0ABP2EUZ9_AJEDR|nr:serine/threonine protein kinase [Blastomyces dermatitidis ER-3]EEQ86727.2 serine/threonine protein kinase [Blastomyces dermatitidis ER-3]